MSTDGSNLVYVDLVESPTPPGLKPGDLIGQAGRWQPFRLKVISGDNQKVLFVSSEAYTNREDAIHAAQLAFGSQANVYLREAEHGNQELRLAQDN